MRWRYETHEGFIANYCSSRPGCLICPACEFGELQPRGDAYLASCDVCSCTFNGSVLRILEQIATLTDALGKHACEECYHPKMRLLPDGTFHCPACGSEVRPITGPSPKRRPTRQGPEPTTHQKE